MIADSVRGGGNFMICGNGGSAADSQHMAAELTSRLTEEFQRPAIAAIALTTDTSRKVWRKGVRDGVDVEMSTPPSRKHHAATPWAAPRSRRAQAVSRACAA